MSGGYLCDECGQVVEGHRNTCICVPSFPDEHRKVRWLGGVSGGETLSLSDACPNFVKDENLSGAPGH